MCSCVVMHRMSSACVPAFGDLCAQPLSMSPCTAFVVILAKFPQVMVLALDWFQQRASAVLMAATSCEITEPVPPCTMECKFVATCG